MKLPWAARRVDQKNPASDVCSKAGRGLDKKCVAKSYSPRGETYPTAMGARPTEMRSSFIARWRDGGGQQVNGRRVGRDPIAKPAAVGDEEKLVKSYVGLPRIPPPPVAQAHSPSGAASLTSA